MFPPERGDFLSTLFLTISVVLIPAWILLAHVFGSVYFSMGWQRYARMLGLSMAYRYILYMNQLQGLKLLKRRNFHSALRTSSHALAAVGLEPCSLMPDFRFLLPKLLA